MNTHPKKQLTQSCLQFWWSSEIPEAVFQKNWIGYHGPFRLKENTYFVWWLVFLTFPSVPELFETGAVHDSSLWRAEVRAAHLGFRLGKGRGDEIIIWNALTPSLCFSVDEYIAIAKEKHGYNMEQVTTLWIVYFKIFLSKYLNMTSSNCLELLVSFCAFCIFSSTTCPKTDCS